MSELHPSFYRHWIAANGWAEALGLGTTLLLGRAVAPVLEQDAGPGTVLLGAVVAVLLGILLEGVVVGAAQSQVLAASLPGLSGPGWIKATMLGAGVAWLLGMIPSTVTALVTPGPSSGAAPVAEPSAALQYGLALVLGAVTGPVLGLGQWLVLRRHVARAGRWILANAAAWAVGMVGIFIGMGRVPWQRGGLGVVLGVYLVCGAAGLVVGAIHGWICVTFCARGDRPQQPPNPRMQPTGRRGAGRRAGGPFRCVPVRRRRLVRARARWPAADAHFR